LEYTHLQNVVQLAHPLEYILRALFENSYCEKEVRDVEHVSDLVNDLGRNHDVFPEVIDVFEIQKDILQHLILCQVKKHIRDHDEYDQAGHSEDVPADAVELELAVAVEHSVEYQEHQNEKHRDQEVDS